jgi:hypothetical protein
LLKPLCDEFCSADFFVAYFGMGVDGSSDRLNFFSRGEDFRKKFHDSFASIMRNPVSAQ